MNQFASLVEANRYAYVGGNPVNTVDLTGFGLTDLVKKGANYVSDNIDRLTENAGGALVEKLYCTGAIVTLAGAGAAAGGGLPGATVGAAVGGLLCGALRVARNPRYPA